MFFTVQAGEPSSLPWAGRRRQHNGVEILLVGGIERPYACCVADLQSRRTGVGGINESSKKGLGLVASAVYISPVAAIIASGVDFPAEFDPQLASDGGRDRRIIEVVHGVRPRVVHDLGPVVAKVPNQIIADVGNKVGRCGG